ncbi:MAG TPA: hypothetical protein ENF45_07515 [Bacteroidetes bacterium]|nr:hypothetical protein [Bacteroidota bacterium]
MVSGVDPLDIMRYLVNITRYGEPEMLSIPPALQAQFEKCLRNTAIPEKMHGLYKKWLELRGIA